MIANDVLLAFLAFAFAIVINRLLAEKALKRLSIEEKAKLLDSFSRNRIFSVVLMLICVLVFFWLTKTRPEYGTTLLWGLLIILILMSVGNGIFSYLKLKKLAMPKHYVSNFLVRCVIYYAALSLVLYTIASSYTPR